ncbi:hypothetical protein T265_10225 [Opisthorchis viverrini]|uniref:Microsomal glutathione S-transferase 1 n=1 Tax=Opisthorchis viverrini TaxID=6198 RepID=A0A075A234_OPIVI|nr:hypothetical protein T265_10225 [Opisthorchis viverrini]KER21464.1 hypothetical protein T265_10225 [Opisthorchis viverrini]
MSLGELERVFAFYSSVLLFKTLFLTGLTIYKRFQHQSFCKGPANAEVEAVRRCHLNDIENLVPFLALGAWYCGISPSQSCALWHFRIFALARVLHTPAYLLTEGRFPRGPIALAGIAVNVSMALQCMAYFWN